MKKVFAGLVTAKPPKEVKAKVGEALFQELSSNKPTLAVPQEDTPLAERMRTLLLYDAALTPSGMQGAYGIEPWALDAARTIRASRLAGDKIPAVDSTVVKDAELQKSVHDYLGKCSSTKYDAALLRYGATVNQPFAVSSYIEEAVNSTDWSSWDSVVNFARRLVELAEERHEPPSGPSPKKPNPDEGDGDKQEQPDDSWLDGDDGDEGDSFGQEPDEKPAPESVEAKEQKQLEQSLMPNPETGAKPRIGRYDSDPWSKGKLPKPSSDKGRPGKLENEDKPDVLPMESKRSKAGFRRRPEQEGTFPRGLHRLVMDRKIFRGAKMKGGTKGRGTVLVDMSGSMGWGEKDFKELLEIMPECTVYGYSGFGGGNSGRMVILADRGKMAKMDEVTKWREGKGSNIIDDSCLRFLAKCSKPRIWISDGGVTGCRDNQTPYIVALCNEAIVRGNIIRVRHAKEALKAMGLK